MTNSSLVPSSRWSDVVLVAGNFNAQVGKPGSSEAILGKRCAVPAQCTDNGDRLLQFCADNHLFLSTKDFRHNLRRTATWRSNSIDNPLVKLFPVLTGALWNRSFQRKDTSTNRTTNTINAHP